MRFLLLFASAGLVLASAGAPAADLKSDAAEIAKVFYGWSVARVETLPGGIGHLLLRNGENAPREGFGQGGQQRASPPGTKVPPPKYDYHVFTEFFALDPERTHSVAQLPWGKDRRPEYHTDKLDLGIWNGRHWYADTGLYHQGYIRTKLGFEGGDDRLALLIKGLGIEDRGINTRNSCEGLLSNEGAEAIPYLEQALRERPQEVQVRCLSALGRIQEEDATRLLLRYFDDPNERLRSAASGGLCYPKFREEAKAAYLAMIECGPYAPNGARAAVQFGWKEAVPLIAGALKSVGNLGEYRDLYGSYRSLSGNPIAKEVLEAEALIRSSVFEQKPPAPSTDDAKKALRESQDHEAIALIAYGLADYRTKADTRLVHAFGLELLDGLPRRSAIAVLEKMARSIREEQTQKSLREILAEWGA